MTPRQYKERAEAERDYQKIRAEIFSEKWHIRLGRETTLGKAKDTMKGFALAQEDVPLVIKLTENPKYPTSKLFTGAVDLFTHDCIHIALGRGLLVKDEAFVIGYTMGSAKKMKRWRRNLFMWVCKYLYPEGYKFGEEERFVFNNGVMLGESSGVDLSVVDFTKFGNLTLDSIRKKFKIDKALLLHYYHVEKRCFPQSTESQRLL
jgi:hypothetical protein